MAAGEITVGNKWATIESASSVNKIIIDKASGSLVNAGDVAVFVSMNAEGTVHADGLQHDGEVQLDPGDTIPLPRLTSVVYHKTAGAAGKLWYAPVSN